MPKRVGTVMLVALFAAAAACSRQPISSPTSPSAALAGPQNSGGSCGGATRKEQLTGPALNGVVPQGDATADMSQFNCGGSTTLTVQVKNVNLPDGTTLAVTLDFSSVGTIRLSGRQGSLVANVGHFAVSNDEVRVNNGSTNILIGPFFK